MFTARIIYPNGVERVIEVDSVIKEITPSEDTNDYIVTIRLDSRGNSEIVTEGDVFVMNDNGKTVASYFLGEKTSETK